MCVFLLRQPLRGFATTAVPGAPGPPDRVAGAQQMAPPLAVAGPQLGAQNGAVKRTADHSSHDHRSLIIEPDEVCRTLPDPVAHWTVIAVDHPSLGLDRLGHTADEFLRIVASEIAPSRLPVYCIQFDVRQLQ